MLPVTIIPAEQPTPETKSLLRQQKQPLIRRLKQQSSFLYWAYIILTFAFWLTALSGFTDGWTYGDLGFRNGRVFAKDWLGLESETAIRALSNFAGYGALVSAGAFGINNVLRFHKRLANFVTQVYQGEAKLNDWRTFFWILPSIPAAFAAVPFVGMALRAFDGIKWRSYWHGGNRFLMNDQAIRSLIESISKPHSEGMPKISVAKKLLISLGILSGFATPFYLYNMSMNGLDDLTKDKINTGVTNFITFVGIGVTRILWGEDTGLGIGTIADLKKKMSDTFDEFADNPVFFKAIKAFKWTIGAVLATLATAAGLSETVMLYGETEKLSQITPVADGLYGLGPPCNFAIYIVNILLLYDQTLGALLDNWADKHKITGQDIQVATPDSATSPYSPV